MKALQVLLLLAAGCVLASTASADLIPLGETDDQGNPSNNAAELCSDYGLCDALFDYKFDDIPDFESPGAGLISGGTYTMENYTLTTPATADLIWDLTGTGYELYAVAVKTAGTVLWYTPTVDQLISSSDTVLAIAGKDSISHISMFVRAVHDIPEPGTLALLGLGLVGLAMRRRAGA